MEMNSNYKVQTSTKWWHVVDSPSLSSVIWRSIKYNSQSFSESIHYQVRSGTYAFFSTDIWLGNTSWKRQFRLLFNIDLDKALQFPLNWMPALSRNLIEEESDQLIALLLYSTGLSPFALWMIMTIKSGRWRAQAASQFSVKAFFRQKATSRLALTLLPPMPPRVQAFTWTAGQNKILTTNQLQNGNHTRSMLANYVFLRLKW